MGWICYQPSVLKEEPTHKNTEVKCGKSSTEGKQHELTPGLACGPLQPGVPQTVCGSPPHHPVQLLPQLNAGVEQGPSSITAQSRFPGTSPNEAPLLVFTSNRFPPSSGDNRGPGKSVKNPPTTPQGNWMHAGSFRDSSFHAAVLSVQKG